MDNPARTFPTRDQPLEQGGTGGALVPLPAPGTPDAAVRAQEPPPSVVLVDDEPRMLHVVGQVLAAADVHVAAVTDDGTRAAELVGRERPDAVVTDFLMPGTDGIQVTRQVRQVDPAVQVVVFTGAVDRGSTVHRAAVEAGIYELVPKGVLAGVLVEVVRRACAAGRRARQQLDTTSNDRS